MSLKQAAELVLLIGHEILWSQLPGIKDITKILKLVEVFIFYKPQSIVGLQKILLIRHSSVMSFRMKNPGGKKKAQKALSTFHVTKSTWYLSVPKSNS